MFSDQFLEPCERIEKEQEVGDELHQEDTLQLAQISLDQDVWLVESISIVPDKDNIIKADETKET